MGHMLNNTIQDILIRKARLDGKNACWVPGTDHASIATGSQSSEDAAGAGPIKKSDVSREEFLNYASRERKYGGIIPWTNPAAGALRLGAHRFTMEPKMEAVLKTFVRLYRKGNLPRYAHHQLGPGDTKNRAFQRGSYL